MQNRPVNVLFAISDTGGGHRSAAVAIDGALHEASEGAVACEIVDILQATRVPVLRSSHLLYDDLSTRWLPFYDFGFRLTDRMWLVEALSRLTHLYARSHLVRMLREMRPGVVVVTHPLTQRLICYLRNAYRLPFRVLTVVTDLVSLHASWTYPHVDLCMVPTDEAYALMQQRGMPCERMLRTGFPVHPKFSHYTYGKEAARRELGIAEDRFTILITGGGVGSGHVEELVPALERAYPGSQLLVISGKNQQLYEDLQAQRSSPHTHIYGFVQNMEDMMAASDVVVSKAGPGTLMEALVMRRPVLVTEAVGMQERGNIDFVINHELGCFCPTTQQIIEAIQDLTDPQRYATTVENLRGAVPSNGSEQIAAIVLEHLAHAGVMPEPVATP
jgi:UDP-N-acetylglucosamine:LPS N-acetylglucosamine transferase